LSRIKVVNGHTNTFKSSLKVAFNPPKTTRKRRQQKRRQKKANDAYNKEWRQTEKGEKE
jgi:hypothetical protein